MVKSGLEKNILKFHMPLQSCCCPVQKNLPRKAELPWLVISRLKILVTYSSCSRWCVVECTFLHIKLHCNEILSHLNKVFYPCFFYKRWQEAFYILALLNFLFDLFLACIVLEIKLCKHASKNNLSICNWQAQPNWVCYHQMSRTTV